MRVEQILTLSISGRHLIRVIKKCAYKGIAFEARRAELESDFYHLPDVWSSAGHSVENQEEPKKILNPYFFLFCSVALIEYALFTSRCSGEAQN